MSPFEFYRAGGTGTHPFPMGSSHDQPCNTGLSLGLAGFEDAVNNKLKVHKQAFVAFKFDHLLPPPLSLGPSSYTANDKNTAPMKRSPTTCDDQDKDFGEGGRYSGRRHNVEDDDDEGEASPCRKKLRLSKDQYALLEDIFKKHATLNPNEKQALAKQLNLRPRQVEVWFQNRRARTKLKQTETECELLKKCCERLSEENKKLYRELLELKLAGAGAGAAANTNTPPAVYMNMPPAATLSICPSCEINEHCHPRKPPVLASNNAS